MASKEATLDSLSRSPTATAALARNLQALGLPLDKSRAATPASRSSFTTADSTLEDKDEDGRPATPTELGPVPPMTEGQAEVIVYPNSRAFIEAMRSMSRAWRLNCVLGPAAAEVKIELATLAERHRDRGASSIERGPMPSVKIWLAVWTGKGEERRLEIVLSKIGARPIVVASPLDLDSEPHDRLLQHLSLLAARLRELLPDGIPTPGGGTEDDFSTPLTNAPAVIGPSILSKPFASLWLGISPAQNGTSSPSTSSASPLRAYGYTLAHLPLRIPLPATSLQDLVTVRLAQDTDDMMALCQMMEDWSATTSTPLDRSSARRAVKAAISASLLWIYYLESQTSPHISLIAGFLTLGSEMSSSIAITAVYTAEIYRSRGVGEALLRAACRHMFKKPRPGKSSIVALVPDPGVQRRASNNPQKGGAEGGEPPALRLFARIGFRILDKEEWTLVGKRDGVDATEGDDETHTQFSSTHSTGSAAHAGANSIPSSPRSRQPSADVHLNGSTTTNVAEAESDSSRSTPVTPPHLSLRRSWERWTELSFDGVGKGSAWSS